MLDEENECVIDYCTNIFLHLLDADLIEQEQIIHQSQIWLGYGLECSDFESQPNLQSPLKKNKYVSERPLYLEMNWLQDSVFSSFSWTCSPHLCSSPHCFFFLLLFWCQPRKRFPGKTWWLCKMSSSTAAQAPVKANTPGAVCWERAVLFKSLPSLAVQIISKQLFKTQKSPLKCAVDLECN